ncbi:MAG: hypothetical protein P9F19_11890 [Candidatus Contendobacter sp.]|nr:hypothetical protein [Candidatus Contendobacter sp.]MDG4558070.1 hypothetical protein [Candidatus Contendobacter sp.]
MAHCRKVGLLPVRRRTPWNMPFRPVAGPPRRRPGDRTGVTAAGVMLAPQIRMDSD